MESTGNDSNKKELFIFRTKYPRNSDRIFQYHTEDQNKNYLAVLRDEFDMGHTSLS